MKNNMRQAVHVRNVPSNCVSTYMREEGLSLRELSSILGSRNSESAKRICSSSNPSRKTIGLLAAREGLSICEFLSRYAPTGKDAA